MESSPILLNTSATNASSSLSKDEPRKHIERVGGGERTRPARELRARLAAAVAGRRAQTAARARRVAGNEGVVRSGTVCTLVCGLSCSPREQLSTVRGHSQMQDWLDCSGRGEVGGSDPTPTL
jgi:hypothetical protein